MSNKFLGTDITNTNLTNGTATIYAGSLGSASLNPSMPIKTDSLRNLISSKLDIADVNNLQSTLNSVLTNPFNGDLTANSFIKNGGASSQYLMADGSTLTQSANSGNSNFYLYNSGTSGDTTPPSGYITYNNNTIQKNSTIIYISHLTRDNFDIEVFFNQISTLSEVYIQDQNASANYIQFNITGIPTITPEAQIEIPVLLSSAGVGVNGFVNGRNVFVSFFTNSLEVDNRISSLEGKTQNQFAIPQTTVFNGDLFSTAFKITNRTGFLKANGNIDDSTYLTPYGASLIYLPLSGASSMTGNINMGLNKITSCGIIETNPANSAPIVFGSGNTIGASSQSIICIGKNNIQSTKQNNNIVGYGLGVYGSNNNTFGTSSGTGTNIDNCITIGNGCLSLANYASCIGNNCNNSIANSTIIGDANITTIYPNSTVCDLGTSSKNFKDLYLSGAIKIPSANSINIGGGNVDNYASGVDNVNILLGDLNTNFNNNNTQIGVGNTNISGAVYNTQIGLQNLINSSQNTVTIGRSNQIGVTYGYTYNNLIGNTQTSNSDYCNMIGYNNSCTSTYQTAIGTNISSNGTYITNIGHSITNNINNSVCLGDSAVTQIIPNSLVCDLGNATKVFKDIYYSGKLINANNKIVLQPAGDIIQNSANTTSSTGTTCGFYTFMAPQNMNVTDINIYRTSTSSLIFQCAIYNMSNVRIGYYIYPSATILTKLTFPMSCTLTAGSLYYFGFYGPSGTSGICGVSKSGVATIFPPAELITGFNYNCFNLTQTSLPTTITGTAGLTTIISPYFRINGTSI